MTPIPRRYGKARATCPVTGHDARVDGADGRRGFAGPKRIRLRTSCGLHATPARRSGSLGRDTISLLMKELIAAFKAFRHAPRALWMVIFAFSVDAMAYYGALLLMKAYLGTDIGIPPAYASTWSPSSPVRSRS